MADILGYRNGRIDLTSLKESRTLRNGMMRPAEEEMTDDYDIINPSDLI